MKKILFLILPFIWVACKDNPKKEVSYEASETTTISETEPHPGKKLMETYCYVCHSPTATMENRIAPPMVAVKMHYIDEDTSKEAFMKDFLSWMKAPSEETTKMPGAVRKFGLMPYTPFPEEDLEKIGEYLFEYDIEQPEWFEDHFNNEHGKGNGKGMGKQKRMQKGMGSTTKEPASLEDKGLEIALSTKAQLGKNLMGKIQKDGTLEALSFCNVKAYPITDSMATVYQASIKRVSDKYRNPKNKASQTEIGYIKTFQREIDQGKSPRSIVDTTSGMVRFYYPIVTNSMCLQCHGIPNETIEKETFAKIKQLYPSDLAIGYDVNQVRGIWSISFEK